MLIRPLARLFAAVVVVGMSVWAEDVHPLKALVDAARTNSPGLAELLRRGMPGLKGRDGAVVWGQEFLFAVESEQPPVVSIDHQTPLAMKRAGNTNVWFRLETLRLGTTHTYTYSAG